MAGERIDYTAAGMDAAKSVLIERMHIPSEYPDDMVLVGGWIPELLLPQSLERHVGSIDVDLALNHKELTEAGYRLIGEVLHRMATPRISSSRLSSARWYAGRRCRWITSDQQSQKPIGQAYPFAGRLLSSSAVHILVPDRLKAELLTLQSALNRCLGLRLQPVFGTSPSCAGELIQA